MNDNRWTIGSTEWLILIAKKVRSAGIQKHYRQDDIVERPGATWTATAKDRGSWRRIEHFSLPWKDSLELWNRIGRPLEVSLDLQSLGSA